MTTYPIDNPYARKHPERFVEAWVKRMRRMPLTLKETGLLLGYTSERIRQIERSAMAKITACARSRIHGEDAA